MITLSEVGYHIGDEVILDRITLRIPRGARIGILGPAGCGKTTLARIIAGTLAPKSGSVRRNLRLSWPINFSSALHPALSGEENIRLIAGFQALDPEALLAQVANLSGLGATLLDPVASYAPGMRVRLALSISLSLRFDLYLADELSTSGSPAFQDVFDAVLLDRADRFGLILLTRHAHAIRRYCDEIYVMHRGRLIEASDLEEATIIQTLATDMEMLEDVR